MIYYLFYHIFNQFRRKGEQTFQYLYLKFDLNKQKNNTLSVIKNGKKK